MDKVKKVSIRVFLTALLFTLITNTVYAAVPVTENKDGSLTKVYNYIAAGKEKKDISIEDEFEFKGNKYKLKEIKYNSKPLKFTEKVKTKDKEDFAKTIEKEISGEKYDFVAGTKNINWEENKESVTLTENIEYKTRNEVEKSIEKDGYTLNLSNVVRSSRLESFSAPARFFSYEKNANTYIFNGKQVEVGNSPIWQGYENDIKAYLGLNGAAYSISSGYFTNENTLIDAANSIYERTATFTGTRNVPYFLATYSYNGESNDKSEYTASVDYIAKGFFETTATCIYEKDNTFLERILTYGGGILAFAGAASALIFFLKKKKGKTSNDTVQS